jgi:HEAT repeat protein
MPFRKPFILALLACSVVTGLLAFQLKETTPSYKGKTLKQWMNLYCWPDNPTDADLFPGKTFFAGRDALQAEAADAVRHIGTNAIPTLLAWEDKDSRVSWKFKLLADLPKSLQSWHAAYWWLVLQDHYRVERALCGFYILGSNATPAVPELKRRMMTRNSDSGVAAASALANIGEAGLPALLSALTNSRTPNRVMIARSVANATRAASNDISGIMVLAQCVRDTDTGVGATAAMELGFITNQPGITVPALIEGLKEPRGQVRSRSADALGNYGGQARSAVPALLQYKNDSDWFVRQCVSNALQKLAPGA